ncbi:MAG: hypothetical protein GKR89_10095 [Candidatus Latescibacteria bacterium]|nr:hypothetical protein [Candidatus Latescibacterota bacterium]
MHIVTILLAIALFSFGLSGSAVAKEHTFLCGGYGPPSTSATNGAAKVAAAAAARVRQGTVNAVVIYAGFADEVTGHDRPPAFSADLFDAALWGSFTHFYQTMSFGQLDLRGAVLPRRYPARQTKASYLSANPADATEIGDYGRFVREVLDEADGEVDFGLFDNDGPDGRPNSGDDDGIVDFLFINVRNAPRGFIRGGATGVGGLGFRDFYVSKTISIRVAIPS